VDSSRNKLNGLETDTKTESGSDEEEKLKKKSAENYESI